MASIGRLVVCAALLSACGSGTGPTVDRAVGSAYESVVIESWSIDGQRDGARTRADLNFWLADGQQLRLNILLAYDPAPVLEDGNWSLGASRGTISAEAVRFVGGQGDGPSVGGRYLLLEDGIRRFRVTIPLTPIASEF